MCVACCSLLFGVCCLVFDVGWGLMVVVCWCSVLCVVRCCCLLLVVGCCWLLLFGVRCSFAGVVVCCLLFVVSVCVVRRALSVA